jgi:hypothetical protein
MALRASQYIDLLEHALGGVADTRLDPLIVVNQALSFLFNLHDWKFRKRPPLDVTFQVAGYPTAQTITNIARSSGTVTVTVAAAPVPAFVVGQTFIVAGVTDTSFDGTFTLLTAPTTLTCTYAQAGTNATSTGGTIGRYAYEQFIDLPPDFGELLAVCTKNNAISNIVPTSLEELAWRRGYVYSTAFDRLYRCALSFPGQATPDDAQPVPRLEIWPRPTASNPAGDLTLTYRAGPIDLVYEADDDSNATDTVPNIPPKFERLLTLLARLFAQGYEEELIQEDPIIQAEAAMLVEADGRQTMNLGLQRGGAAALKPTYQNRPFSVIGNPSNRL